MTGLIQMIRLFLENRKMSLKLKQNRENQAKKEASAAPTKSVKKLRDRELTDAGTPMVVLPTNSIDTLHAFLNSNKPLMYNFLLKSMNDAIKHDWNACELFRVGDTSYVARIVKSDYEKILVDMKMWFMDHDQFEKASIVLKLMEKNQINILLKSINNKSS